MEEDAIRALLVGLSRPHPSGGRVIERAAILAAGADFTEILEWIAEHEGKPEALAPKTPTGGLHGARIDARGGKEPTPRRYVIPPGVLS